MLLRGLRVSENAIRTLSDLNLARLRLLALVERDGEYAVVKLGVDLLIAHRWREREAAQEPCVTAFVQQPAGLLLFALLVRLLALGGNRERLVFQSHVNVLF